MKEKTPDRNFMTGDFLLISGSWKISNWQNNTAIYSHICIIISASLHNTDKNESFSTVGTTAITALQRFGGMMMEPKEHIHYDTTKESFIISE